MPEPGSDVVFDVWSRADRIVSSLLLYAEARAAVSRAARSGRLPGRSSRARALVDRLWLDIDRIDPTEELARRAGDLAESQKLRGYDAVHLASLEQTSADDPVLLSADSDLLDAAHSLGFATIALNE